jgi:hypothetical protein
METTNYYADKSNRQFLNGKKKFSKAKTEIAADKNEKWKETAKDVGKDLLVGVLGGGLAAATIGRPAFFVGLALSTYGHHTENKSLSALGLGMMASGTMTALNSNSKIPELPERLKLFQEELKRKLFLDKIFVADKKVTLSGTKSEVTTSTIKQKPSPTTADFIMVQDKDSEILRTTLVENIQSRYYSLDEEDDDQWNFRSNNKIY